MNSVSHSQASIKTSSGIQIAVSDIAHWVGLHYRRNFDAESAECRQDWADRYAEAHGIRLVNDAQRVLLATYSCGDFEHLIDVSTAEALSEALKMSGDGLLRYLMSDLSTHEDCVNLEEAIGRVRNCIESLQSLETNLRNAQALGTD